MDFAQVQVVKVAILAIVVGTLVVLGIAYTEGVFNKPEPEEPSYEGYPENLVIDSHTTNDFGSKAHVYLENADGTSPVLIDAVGTYPLPEEPVIRVSVNDKTFSLGEFGGDVYIYKEDWPYSYMITTGFTGAVAGEITIDGYEATFPLSIVYGYSAVKYELGSVFALGIIEYLPNDGAQSPVLWSKSNSPPTLEEVGFTAPEGKELDYWSYYQDGSGEKLIPGDTTQYIPWGASPYAQWKEAGPPVYPSTFVVSEDYANSFTGVVDLYLDSLDGSSSQLINAAGTYDLPEYPILRAILKDSSYSLGIFDGRPLIYKAGAGSSYEVMTAINCCSGAAVIDYGTTSCSLLLSSSQGTAMSFMAPSIYEWKYDYYILNNGTKDLVMYASDHPETAETLGITAPAGKVLDCWTTGEDGTGNQYTPGDTEVVIPRGLFLYAQWKNA